MPSPLPRASTAAAAAAASSERVGGGGRAVLHSISSSISHPLVPSRLRVYHQSLLVRRGRVRLPGVAAGRSGCCASTRVGYSQSYLEQYQAGGVEAGMDWLDRCPRLIDAEAIHGDEQEFWGARRSFRRSGARRSYYPSWDRQAQTLLAMVRRVPRVPVEAAFRLLTLGLRAMLLPRVTAGLASPLLPAWVGLQGAGLGPLRQALEREEEDTAAAVGAPAPTITKSVAQPTGAEEGKNKGDVTVKKEEEGAVSSAGEGAAKTNEESKKGEE